MTYYTGPKTLRNKLNEWFAKQNHIKLPKNAISKLYVSVAEAWTPANLFPTGTEEGLFLDFSDISTLYTDQTFATNISAIGDPVGGVLDKSQGLVLGADDTPNGVDDLSMGTGWTNNGDGTASHSGASAGYATVIGGLTVGSLYEISLEITENIGGRRLELVPAFWLGGIVIGSTVGNYKVLAIPTNVNGYIYANNAGTSLTISNLSIRELPGNHLIQATAAARPIWTRHPKSGVRNIVDRSDDLDTITTINGTITKNVASGPTGVPNEALRISPDASDCYVYYDVGEVLTGEQITFSLWVKKDTVSDFSTRLRLYQPGVAEAGSVNIDYTSEWQRYSVNAVADRDYSNMRCAVGTGSTFSSGEVGLFARAQIERTSSMTDYQSRVSKYDVTEAGVADCYGLTFDGVDDWMYTAANLDMSGTNKATWCVGGYNPGTANGKAFKHGGFDLNGGFSADYNTANITAGGKGTVNLAVYTTVDAPVYSVASSMFDTALGAGAAMSLSLNGGAPVYALQNPNGGQLANTVFQLGSRNGGNERVTGTIYGITLTDYILDADQLAALEAWTAANTPEVTLA